MSYTIANRSREQQVYWYTLNAIEKALIPYEVAGKHISQKYDNVTTRNAGVTLVKVNILEALEDIDDEEMLDEFTLPTGEKAVYAFHGSSVKEGWVYMVIVRDTDGSEIPHAITWLSEVHNELGIYENLYRGGSHFFPHTMFSILNDEPVKAMRVPDGTIVVCADGKKSIIRDGHSVIDHTISNAARKSGRKPFDFTPATLAPPNVLGQLDWNEEVGAELLKGFEVRSKALHREGYTAFLSALRFGDERGALEGQSTLGNIAFIEDIAGQLDKVHGINREIQAMLIRHPAFADKLSKRLSKDMYRTATTGALKGTYFKYLPCPTLLEETDPVVVVNRKARTGQVAVTRQPVSDRKSTLAAIAKMDDRNAYRAQAMQYRLGGHKGIASIRNLEGAQLYTPDGQVMDAPAGVAILFGEEDAKFPAEKARPLLEVYEIENFDFQVTEWYRPANTLLFPCGYVVGENGCATYHEELDHAHSQNADFDGDGGSVWWLQEKPLTWQALYDNNQVDIQVAKMKKSKTPMPHFTNLAEYRQKSIKIYDMLQRSCANYVGMVTNYLQRYFLFNEKQRHKMAVERFNMTARELEAEFGFYLQLAVDLFKFDNPELIEALDEFLKMIAKGFSDNKARDGCDKIPFCHVGKDKNDRIVGDGEMWFVNHIPEVSGWEMYQGFVPQMMMRTLERGDDGTFVRWHGELSKSWGILPNSVFNIWTTPPSPEAAKLAQHLIVEYGRQFRGVAVGYQLVDKYQAKSDWREKLEEFSIYARQKCREESLDPQAVFDAMWYHYTQRNEQKGDQSLPIAIFPHEFIVRLKSLVKDWDGRWVHPDLKGKLDNETEEVPLLNVSRLWLSYPDTPMIEKLNGKTIRVTAECSLINVNRQQKVVSIVTPAEDFSEHLNDFPGMPFGSIGYTNTIYEGEFKARFRWVPAKSGNGGSMMTTFYQA